MKKNYFSALVFFILLSCLGLFLFSCDAKIKDSEKDKENNDKTYTITFKQNIDGTEFTSTFELTGKEKFSSSQQEQIKKYFDKSSETHTFEGWYDNKNFSGKELKAEEVTIDKDMTFYGKWQLKPFGTLLSQKDFSASIKHATTDGKGKFYLIDTANKLLEWDKSTEQSKELFKYDLQGAGNFGNGYAMGLEVYKTGLLIYIRDALADKHLLYYQLNGTKEFNKRFPPAIDEGLVIYKNKLSLTRSIRLNSQNKLGILMLNGNIEEPDKMTEANSLKAHVVDGDTDGVKGFYDLAASEKYLYCVQQLNAGGGSNIRVYQEKDEVISKVTDKGITFTTAYTRAAIAVEGKILYVFATFSGNNYKIYRYLVE